MSIHDHSHDHAAAGHDDHGGVGKYLVVFVALCFLTMMSFLTYSDMWPFSQKVAWVFMMAVSCTKAMLVILFFMHLKWEANWKYVLTVPASFMSLFLVLMLVPDVGLRMRHASRERLMFSAVPEFVPETPQEPAENAENAEDETKEHSASGH